MTRLVIGILACACGVSAQVGGISTPAPRQKVFLDVTADQSIKSLIQSYVGRELRDLRDVTIVEDNVSRWRLRIVALPISEKGGQVKGVAVVYVFAERMSPYPELFAEGFGEDGRKGLAEEYSGYELPIDTGIILKGQGEDGGTSELKSTCQGIVADFDSKVLQPWRAKVEAIRQRMKDD